MSHMKNKHHNHTHDISCLSNVCHMDDHFSNVGGGKSHKTPPVTSGKYGTRRFAREGAMARMYPYGYGYWDYPVQDELQLPYSSTPRMLRITNMGRKFLSTSKPETLTPDYETLILTALADGRTVTDIALANYTMLPNFNSYLARLVGKGYIAVIG